MSTVNIFKQVVVEQHILAYTHVHKQIPATTNTWASCLPWVISHSAYTHDKWVLEDLWNGRKREQVPGNVKEEKAEEEEEEEEEEEASKNHKKPNTTTKKKP